MYTAEEKLVNGATQELLYFNLLKLVLKPEILKTL
jgi:hypothetical protein